MNHNDCWNRIGTWGDGSCPKLAGAVHCRNCPVYSDAAGRFLDREVDDEYLTRWAQHYRVEPPATAGEKEAVVIFRLGAEWLALAANLFQEVCDLRPVHSLPHRRDGTVLGIVNVRGALVVCVSLHALLGIEAAAVAGHGGERHLVHRRMLVAGQEGDRLVFPVDEIHGIHRFAPSELGGVPPTVGKSTATYSRAMLPWREKAVGVLDELLLFYSLNKSLA